MFRLWGKLYKNNRIIKDLVVEDSSDKTRTHKVYSALTSVCLSFDLSEPIWLSSNISEFKRRAKTRFNSDNFIEKTDFDFLEIQIIEED
ncbi:MAG: hypothetical protein HUJ76_04740 [Parasporobacterium sp.]|nr:hypothetical protein [Parasporobacterium sp.]